MSSMYVRWYELLDSYGLDINCLQHYELLGASKFQRNHIFIKIIFQIKKINYINLTMWYIF